MPKQPSHSLLKLEKKIEVFDLKMLLQLNPTNKKKNMEKNLNLKNNMNVVSNLKLKSKIIPSIWLERLF